MALHLSLQSLHGAVASRRALRMRIVCASDEPPNDNRARSHKGQNFEDKKRRRGRPAHLRSPYDTPLRDGNRDRLIGLLTDRCGAGGRAGGGAPCPDRGSCPLSLPCSQGGQDAAVLPDGDQPAPVHVSGISGAAA